MVSIRRLEQRRRRSVSGGALIGGAVGFTVGAATMFVVWAAENCLSLDFSTSSVHCPAEATGNAVTFGATAAGAIIGSLVRGEHWVRVPLSRVHASLAPTGVRIAIEF
jgi:hypothetical protein